MQALRRMCKAFGTNKVLQGMDLGVADGEFVVPGAQVVLYGGSFVTDDEGQRTRTGDDGTVGNARHALQFPAEAPGLERSKRVTVRKLFRSQDTRLQATLGIGSAPS